MPSGCLGLKLQTQHIDMATVKCGHIVVVQFYYRFTVKPSVF